MLSNDNAFSARQREFSHAQVQRSHRLGALIRDVCAKHGGSVGFDQFMELALYSPRLGYYNADEPRIGSGGDFTTAPELSPRFAACLARPIADTLRTLGGGSVLEVGAGRGTLARDLIAALDALRAPLEHYSILERSATARAEQGQVLHGCSDRVQWLEGLPGAGFRGVVLANELLDAIASHRFVVSDHGVRELRVAPSEDGFAFVAGEFSQPNVAHDIEDLLQDLPPLASGYVSEFGPARAAWLASVATCLSAGLVLLIDYGYPRPEYYHAQRSGGTLTAFRQHRIVADPLRWPGLQDLSVHVEFTALAEVSVACGLRVAGFTTQAHFLIENGALEGLDDVTMAPQHRRAEVQALRRLTLPGEMGELVKVMALTRELPEPLAGFTGRDMRHRL